jgi:hypothetical protein
MICQVVAEISKCRYYISLFAFAAICLFSASLIKYCAANRSFSETVRVLNIPSAIETASG